MAKFETKKVTTEEKTLVLNEKEIAVLRALLDKYIFFEPGTILDGIWKETKKVPPAELEVRQYDIGIRIFK